MRVVDDEGGLTVHYAKGKSQVPRLDDQDFPMTPEVKAEGRVSIEGPVLARLIQRTSYAVSSDETRAVLNGVYFVATDKDLTLVATDGHRLARARRNGSFAALGKEGFVVPGRTVALLGRMAAEATSPVEVGLAPARNQAAFRMKVGAYDVVVFTRLLEGPYPTYEQVIPKTNQKLLSIARRDARGVDRVSTHSDNITHQVRLDVGPNRVTVRVNTPTSAPARRRSKAAMTTAALGGLQRQLPARHSQEPGHGARRGAPRQTDERRHRRAGRRSHGQDESCCA